jgi:hypothetical protein
MKQLLGQDAVSDRRIGDLLNGVPTVNQDFRSGSEAALKIQAVASGQHRLQDDPDYHAAREAV